MLYIVRYQRRIKSIIANNDGETSTLRDSIPAKCSVTRRSISLSINWMAPPVVSPPPIRLVEYSSVGCIRVSLERCRMKNWHPGPAGEETSLAVENFQIGWWKVQKFTCCPAEWISASVSPRWTCYSDRVLYRVARCGCIIRWEEEKWEKRRGRGIFPLTFSASLREKKNRVQTTRGLFKHLLPDLFNEIYSTLAFFEANY